MTPAPRVPQLMYMHWMNTMVGYCGPFKYESEYCEKLRSYLEANLAWMEEQMGKGQDPEYWHQVRMGHTHTPRPVPHRGEAPYSPLGPSGQGSAGCPGSWPGAGWDKGDVAAVDPSQLVTSSGRLTCRC